MLPASTWYDCPVTVNSSTPLVTWTSSSPGCCIGLRPLVAPGATVARAPASRNRPYGPEMLLRSIPLCEVYTGRSSSGGVSTATSSWPMSSSTK